MNTLSHVRRVQRFVRSKERKALKKQMDGYNSLARPARGGSHETEDSPDTIHDISERLSNTMSQHVYDRSISKRVLTRKDKVLQGVVSPEVRELWHAKIGMASLLTDETRAKLLATTRNVSTMRVSTEVAHMYDVMHDVKLTQLARWMVTQWCDVEGFNPNKVRTRLLHRIKYNVTQRVF